MATPLVLPIKIKEFSLSAVTLQEGKVLHSIDQLQNLDTSTLDTIFVQHTNKLIKLLVRLKNTKDINAVNVLDIICDLQQNFDEIHYTSTKLYIALKRCYPKMDGDAQHLIDLLPILECIKPIINRLPKNKKALKNFDLTNFNLTELTKVLSVFPQTVPVQIISQDVVSVIQTLKCDADIKSLLLSMSSALVGNNEQINLFNQSFNFFAKNSKDQLPQMLQCAVELMKFNHYEEALSLFKKAFDKIKDPKILTEVKIDEAICLINAEKYENALNKLKKIKLEPSEQQGIFSIVKLQCYELLGRLITAQKDYKIIKEATFDDVDLVLLQAKYALYFENDRSFVVEKILPLIKEKEINTEKLNADLLYILAITHYANRNFEEGIKYLKSALSIKEVSSSLFLKSDSPYLSHIVELALENNQWSNVQGILNNIETLNDIIISLFYKECYSGSFKNIQFLTSQSKIQFNSLETLFYIINGNGSSEDKKNTMSYLKQANLLDLNIGNGYALELAVQKNDMLLVNFLMNNEVKMQPHDDGILLYYAAQKNNYNMFFFLKDSGIDINQELLNDIKCLELSGSMKVAIDNFSL